MRSVEAGRQLRCYRIETSEPEAKKLRTLAKKAPVPAALRGAAVDEPCISLPASSLGIKDAQKRDVKRFLNRLLCLPVWQQAALFSYFLATLEVVSAEMKQAGQL